MVLAIRHPKALYLLMVLCSGLLIWSKAASGIGILKDNLLAVELSSAIQSNNAAQMERMHAMLSSRLATEPENDRILAWWTSVQMARGESPALIPLLENKTFARNERGRVLLIGIGNYLLNDSDVHHFQLAWQQAGVWEKPSEIQCFQVLLVGIRAVEDEKWETALALFRIIEGWKPDDPKTNRYLAHILEMGYGDIPRAIIEREEVVRVVTDNYWDWMALGDLYKRVGRWNEALQAFKKAAEVDPEQEKAVTEAAKILRTQDNMDDAIHLLETYLEMNTDSDFVTVRLAELYVSQGQLESARLMLEYFLERDDDNVPVLVTLGALYYDEYGLVDEAYDVLIKAIQQDGDPYYLAWGHRILAEIALFYGDEQKADWHEAQADWYRAIMDTK